MSSVAPEELMQKQGSKVQTFIQLFIMVLLIIGIPFGIWILIDQLRAKKSGCFGHHDCVTYKGERVMCPSCELREQQARFKKSNTH